MMSSIPDIFSMFQRLHDQVPTVGGDLPVESLDPNFNHKVGCSTDGYPMVFVECADDASLQGVRLNAINVDFNQLCTLQENSQSIQQKYSIITLTSLEVDLQKYFLEVCSMVLRRFPTLPRVAELKAEIVNLARIFMAPPSLSEASVQGLWAELFVIASATDPAYLIGAWHPSPDDKYDFNDGADKVEVKSTNGVSRVHQFSIEQLSPNAGSELAIASVFAVRSGEGCSVFDLLDDIANKVTDTTLMAKASQVVLLTLGPSAEKARDIKFDLQQAISTYRVYDYRDVPTIHIDCVPPQVSAVRFAVCLDDVPMIDAQLSTSRLIASL